MLKDFLILVRDCWRIIWSETDKRVGFGSEGSIDEPGLKISWGGLSPVHGGGVVDGHPCYYKSHEKGWQFRVASRPGGNRMDADAWKYSESPYAGIEGSYVDPKISEKCIRRAALLWRAHMRESKQ